MESEMLTLLREKFQHYSEEIQHFLNVELEIRGDGGDIVDYTVPGTTTKVTFNPDNDGYGIKLFNGKDFLFVSPAEMSLEDGKSIPLEEGMLQLKESDIRNVLELLKETSDSLREHVNNKKEEFQEKINLVSKY